MTLKHIMLWRKASAHLLKHPYNQSGQHLVGKGELEDKTGADVSFLPSPSRTAAWRRLGNCLAFCWPSSTALSHAPGWPCREQRLGSGRAGEPGKETHRFYLSSACTQLLLWKRHTRVSKWPKQDCFCLWRYLRITCGTSDPDPHLLILFLNHWGIC